MGEIGDYLVGRALENFRKERDFDNQAWAPLSPATISDKEKKGYPRATLVRKSNMKKGITKRVSNKSVKIIVPFPGEFHQKGTSKTKARKILPEGKLGRTDERNIIDIAVGYLKL